MDYYCIPCFILHSLPFTLQVLTNQRQIKFSVLDIQVLQFCNICSLTYFHTKKKLEVNNIRKYQELFSYEHSVSLGQPQYTYGFSNFSLLLFLKYARNSGIYIIVGT